MIIKDETKKNKYILTDTSCNDDMRKICDGYEHIRCLICNSKTVKRFGYHYLNPVPITINNKIEDNVFYLNSIS